MKKNKAKTEKQSAGQQAALPALLLPAWLLMGLMTAWAALVLIKYYKIYPVSLDTINFYFSMDFPEAFSPVNFAKVLGRNILSALAAFFIFFAANGLGKLISERIGTAGADKTERFVVDTGLGIIALMMFFTAVGMAGFFYIYLIVPVLIAFSAVNVARINKEKFEPGYLIGQFKAVPLYGKLILLAGLFVGLVGSFTPETFYDAISYHISIPQYWINVHAIKTMWGYHSSFIVAYVHTVYAVALMLGNEISAKFVNLSFAVLSAYAILAICRRFFTFKAAVTAVLVFVTVPVSLIVSTRTGLEYPLTFIELMAFYSALCLVDPANDPSNETKWAAVAGAFLGISIASKYTSGGALLGMIAGLSYYYVSGGNYRKLLKALAVGALVVAVVVSPWIIRNYAQTGHPLFPFVLNDKHTGFTIMIHGVKAPLNDMAPLKPGVQSILSLPWDLTMGYAGQEGYIGPAFLLLFPLLLVFRGTDRKVKFIAVYFIVYFLFWAIGRPYLRYFLPAVAVLSVALGYALSLVPQKSGRYFSGAIAVICCTNIIFAMGIQKNIQDPLGVVTGMQSKHDYLSTQRPSYVSPYYNVAEWINKNLPKNAKVMVFCDSRGYYIKRDYVLNLLGDYCPLIEYIKETGSERRVYDKLKSEGITHLLINSNELKRTPAYDSLYWDAEGLKTFHEFWKKHVRLGYADIADISIPSRSIFSMKLQQPQWWERYSSDYKNYVYVYEILDERAAEEKPAPLDLFLLKEYYPASRWDLLKDTAEKLSKG